MKATNISRRGGGEYVPKPPAPDVLEKEMRKESKLYIQFVIRMLPPVYGKEIWSDVAEKTKLSAFVTTSQEAFALLLYKNGFEAWSWMNSDSSSSSDGSETGMVKSHLSSTNPDPKITSWQEVLVGQWRV